MTSRQDFTIHQMRLFSAVARHGSLSRAASALSVPQPAISRLVGRIEATVGLPLLARSGQGVSLTEAGQRFLSHAEKALHYHDLAYSDLQDLRGKLVGETRIAAPESVGDVLFAPLIKHFQAKHSDAAVRTVAASSVSIPALLDNGVVDIGIVADTHPRPAGPLEALCREEFYLIGKLAARETAKAEIPLEAVAALPLILNAMPGGFRTVIDAAFARLNLTPKVCIEIDANRPLLDLILAGEGFSILPFSIVSRKHRLRDLSASRIVEPVLSRRLSLAIARGRAVTPVCREAARQIKVVMRHQAEDARWLAMDEPAAAEP